MTANERAEREFLLIAETKLDIEQQIRKPQEGGNVL